MHRRGPLQGQVLPEDALIGRSEPGAGVDPQLIGDPLAARGVRGDGLGLAPDGAEREHELLEQRLPQRMSPHEIGQEADDRVRAPRPHRGGRVQLHPGEESIGDGPPRLRDERGLPEVLQRRPEPIEERRQRGLDREVVAGLGRPRSATDRVEQLHHVDRRRPEGVARGRAPDGIRAELATQPGHGDLHDVDRGRRRGVLPQRPDEGRPRHRPARLEGQVREHRPGAARAQHHRLAVHVDGERAQQGDLEQPVLLSGDRVVARILALPMGTRKGPVLMDGALLVQRSVRT